MKIVCVGDVLLPPEMMKAAMPAYSRYDKVKYFFFGPQTRTEMRAYIKKMEAEGSRCVPVTEEIMREIEDADVLQVHMMPVPSEVFDRAKKLKIVASNRGGVENIDIAAATAHNIPVIANPAHNANAVAEMTLGLILAETRNISRCHADLVYRGIWGEKFPNSGRIHELKSLTAGIIGFGTIARLVVSLLKAFRMQILVYDPFVPAGEIEAEGAKKVELNELLAGADIVSMHARVSDSTKGMMGREQFARMKPTAYFINTARPALVDMDALYQALESRTITGAAIDVFSREPLPADDPFLKLDNITMTCHKGGDTVESYADSPDMLLHETERFFAGQTPRFIMNPEVLR